MAYQLALLYSFIALGVVGWGSYLLYDYFKQKKLQQLLSNPFPQKYQKILQTIPLYTRLTPKDQQKIERSIEIFLFEKEFVGVGMPIDDTVKVVIAFHACLLTLHVTLAGCYSNLQTILVYPYTIIAKHLSNNGGIFSQGEFLLEGQSASDTVVLSWHDVKRDAYHPSKNNVIVHEFAHELDFLDGMADGTPPLSDDKYHEWAKVLSHEFNKLSQRALKNREWGKYKFIGSYAATNEAEFFAVISERYFEKPQSLKKHFPDLFEELEQFYHFYGQKRGVNFDG